MANTFFRLSTPWGDFVERSADELTARVWANEASYKARQAPTQVKSWGGESGMSLSRAFFADGDATVEPELDPIPVPSEADLAKIELATLDASGALSRNVEDLWAWAKSNGFQPAAAADKRITNREAIRAKIK